MTWKWNGVWVVFFLILASTLAGCTQPYYGYPGPRLPETETALLVPDVGVKIYSSAGTWRNQTSTRSAVPRSWSDSN